MHYAQINNSTGEVEVIYTTTEGQPAPVEGVSGDVTILKLEDDNIESYLHSKYYDNEWRDKPAKPGKHYNFLKGDWIFQEEAFLSEVRRQRKGLLSASDWTQMPDSPMSDEERVAWATYRQQLRDFPATITTETTMEELVWPTAP